MQVRQLSGGAERSFVVVLDSSEEAMASLLAFAREHDVKAGRLTGIGAFETATLGFFDFARKDYERIRVDEQVEVLSLVGDFATEADSGAVKLHAHVVVGKRDGTAHGGHLLEARVRPTLEVMVVDAPANLQRRSDPATGLPLLDL